MERNFYVLIDDVEHVISRKSDERLHIAITQVRENIKRNFGKKVKIHIYDVKEKNPI